MAENYPMPSYIRDILGTLRAAGYDAYAVGGCVRDSVMGRVPHDWDIASSAPAEDVRRLFPKTVPTGIRFGTVTVLTPGGQAEVTTFRRDGEYLNGRRPETVEFVPDLREDLARRDFTVNAMAMDITGAVTDPFGGREDIARRTLRCVGDPERRFSEDALRMLRAVRFSAQLGFDIEPATLSALSCLAGTCRRLSAERVRDELSRSLDSPRPELTALMIEYGLVGRYISENGKNIPWSRIPLSPPGEERLAVFALLVSRAGGADCAGGLLTALRCPAHTVRTAALAESIAPALTPDPVCLRRALCLEPAAPVITAAASLGFRDAAVREARAGLFTRVRDLAVDGSDLSALGLSGPAISSALRSLALAVTSGEVENTRESLLIAAGKNK